MNKYLAKCLTFALVLIFGICATTMSVKALNTVDFTKKGSITISLKDPIDSNGIEGIQIGIYKLADVYDDNHNLGLAYDEKLNLYKEELKSGKLSQELIYYIKSNIPLSQTLITTESGEVTFQDIELGLYLITQLNESDKYSEIEEFLVIMPEIKDNNWNYHIEATPKINLIRQMDLTVLKVWNVTDNNIPEYVTVELLKAEEIIDTVNLNKENNWTYTWKQIEESDLYSVREINIPKDFKVTYRQEENTFIVTNTKKLIQTGQAHWLVGVMAACGLIFLAIGFTVERKKHE